MVIPSYTRRMKTAISVPDETFARVDVAARGMGMSRSEFFSRAAERWLEALADERTTVAINDAIAGVAVDTRFSGRAGERLAGSCEWEW